MARLLAPVLLRLGVLVALLALVAIAGVVASTRAFDYLTEDLQPAAAANQDVLLDLTSMQAAVGAWARSGEEASRDDYEQLSRRLPGHQEQVRAFVADDAQLDLLVARRDTAVRAWIETYADPRVAAPGGPDTFRAQRFRLGQRAFAEVEEAHRATTEAFDRRVREADQDAQWRLRGTILGVLVLTGLAWAAVARARRQMLRQLSEPLVALEAVVQAMLHHDTAVRASLEGPREVRAVAAAVNQLADDQARARAVETRIQRDLRSLDTAKDDFVSNVSHELRTPLTTISGYLELVAEEFEGTMAPRHERMLEATRRNVTRLKSLIDDLLTLAKAETRATDPEPVDLAQVVRDAVTDVRIGAAGRGITLDVTTPEQPALVLGDRAMLHRAFLNVLTNAVKFSRDDGSVEVRVTQDGGRAEVVVTDRGIGIPELEVARLGTRFFRASNAVADEIAGTGLGIRLVQTIVEKHQGDLRIGSREGEGTTVSVRLPVHAARE